jgi:hypothetical protein
VKRPAEARQPESVTSRQALREFAQALPAGAVVPVPKEWLLELLGEADAGGARVEIDLTVNQVAQRFSRRPSTVRGWCEASLLPGAYRNRGREWRIPATALVEFQERERKRPEGSDRAGSSGQRRSLADWRHAS